jgi:long-chain acyl-CoA synthetase
MIPPTLLHHGLQHSARRLGDKIALVSDGQEWTYRDLEQRSDQLAYSLIGWGIKPQDRMVIFLDNSAETVIAMYGVSKAGGIFTILNSTLKSAKLAYILDDVEAALLITHTAKFGVVREALGACRQKPAVLWVHPDPSLPDSVAACGSGRHWNSIESAPPRLFPLTPPDAIAALIYTSGSTGEPRAVIQPHDKMIHTSNTILGYIGNTEQDVILNVLSLSFGYGLYQILMSVLTGGTVVLERSFVFLHRVLEQIPRYRVTGFPLVPTIVAMLLKMDNLSQYDFSSLRYITSAGAALPVRYTKWLRTLLPQTRIIPMYGLTECVRVSYLPPDQIDLRPDSAGIDIPNCRTMVVDESGREVPANTPGELVITGPNVMPGYWNNPELSAEVFRPGPMPDQTLLYTGDLFRKDNEGYLYFLGRKDDMIKTRGERVSPKEVENVLSQFPGVAEVAVIGVPDEVLGQAIAAFIVPAPGATPTENDLLRQSTQQMETFMVPKYIRLIDNLPKTPNGKIDKKLLKSMEDIRP